MRLFLVAALIALAPAFSAATSLSVSAAPVQAMGVEYHAYYFGRVPVNYSAFVRWNITNTGSMPLDFHSSYISGIGYDARHNCIYTLYPGQTCAVEIRYWPPFEGYHSGRFELYFLQNAGIDISLSGEGVRY